MQRRRRAIDQATALTIDWRRPNKP